jgi:hypothetical protein
MPARSPKEVQGDGVIRLDMLFLSLLVGCCVSLTGGSRSKGGISISKVLTRNLIQDVFLRFCGLGDDCVPGYFAVGLQAFTELMKRGLNPLRSLRESSKGYSTQGQTMAILLALGAVLFLFAGHVTPVTGPIALALMPEQGGAPLVSGSGFAENAVYSSTAPPTIAAGVKRFGSWLGSDRSVGKAQSLWFPAVPAFHILVAGYAVGEGCEIFVETEETNGKISRIAISPDVNPGESWQMQTISFANSQQLVRFRIVATDASTGARGWIGFSQPFQIAGSDVAELVKQLVLVGLTACATLVAMLFPGLFMRHRSCMANRPQLAFVWVPVPGFLGLAILGLLSWIAPRSLGVRHIPQWVFGLLFCCALYHAARFPLSTYTTRLERRVLLAVLVLASLTISKSIYSLGPVGELYHGQISRTLEIGGRSDSRIPYHVVQLIGWKSRPYSGFATSLFSPWNFSSRGPLAGFAASPIVLAAPVRLPNEMPNQAWTVYDPQGFSAFRIAMIVTACCSLIAVFGVAGLFLDANWALLAFLVTATTPFVIHEIYFTWPKLEAAWFVLLAAYLMFRARYFLAGLLVGIGYLCHPLALLSMPALLAIAFLSNMPFEGRIPTIRKLYIWSSRAAAVFLGVAIWMAIWGLVNRKHYVQSGFLSYFVAADGQIPNVRNWLLSRWNSISNTLIPLNLFLLHRTNPGMNSIEGKSPLIVQFYLQYWITLPFGVGISYFFFLLKFLYSAFLRARAWLLLVVAVPFGCFAAYWGADSSGMLREGLHPWVLSIMILSIVMWQRTVREHKYSEACALALLIRGVETLSMLLIPAVATQHRLVDIQFALSDAVALATMAASAGWLYIFTFRHAWSLVNAER